jgi:arginyl-tRNA synthetase
VNAAALAASVSTAVTACLDGEQFPGPCPDHIVVERPKNRDHGDYATNVALRLARDAGRPAREIAAAIAARLRGVEGIASAEVAGPGLVNVMVTPTSRAEVARAVVEAGEAYGRGDALAGYRVNLEFVPAGPTGPLTVASAYPAVVGDALARVLAAAGASVTRERRIDEDADEEIKASLDALGVDFDVHFRESSLHATGAVDTVVRQLENVGKIYFADGALWLRSGEYGDRNDRVVVDSDGRPTRVVTDIAHAADKRARGFDLCIWVLGSGCRGYVDRLEAGADAVGDGSDAFEVLVAGGRPVRTGPLVVTELVGLVGADAVRYSLVRGAVESALDIDVDALVRRTDDNPLYRVQYAHARLSALARHAVALGVARSSEPETALLTHEREVDLLGALGEFPRVVAAAAEMRAPHRVAHYLEELAGICHRFHDSCRVLPRGDEPATPLTDARLWLGEAARVVVANGLALLGVTAPERM